MASDLSIGFRSEVLLPSSTSGLAGDLVLGPLCVGFVCENKEIVWVAPTQTETNCYASCYTYEDFFFSHGPIKYKYFWNRSIWPITLTDTTTLCQSGTGSNGIEGIHNVPPYIRTEASLSDSITPWTCFFSGILLCRAFSQRISSFTD